MKNKMGEIVLMHRESSGSPGKEAMKSEKKKRKEEPTVPMMRKISRLIR